MKNNLTTTQNTDLILKKSKSTLNITKRILSGSKSLGVEVDESWMERLWDWADENEREDNPWIYDGVYSRLPRDKKTLLKLKRINFYFNDISELPEEIGNLINLRELDFYDNALKKLPKEIGNLINLRILDLSYNNLSELPKEIGDLVNLRVLIIDNGDYVNYKNINNPISGLELRQYYTNSVNKLPREIGNLINLRQLSIENNKLSELPKEISKSYPLNGAKRVDKGAYL